jgi:DNA modification methylase
MDKPEMRIAFSGYDELVKLSSLKKSKHQRNKHPKEQIERLAKIMREHGVRHPIHVSKLSGQICFGHGRLEAAKLNGWKEYPVVYQTFKNDDEEYACVQSDNAIAHWAELDLSAINTDLANLGPDFDIDLLGIKDFVLEPAEKFEAQCDEDEVPEQVDTRCKLGDIWTLGRHRLMCGDSTSITDVEKLMAGERADMVFTDPPYNTGMSAKKNYGSTRLSHMFDDDYTDEQWANLLGAMSANYWIISKDASAHYVCLNWKRSHELVPAYLKAGFKFSNLIVWDKVVHGLGSDYKYTHEYIHLFKKGSPEINSHQGDGEFQDIWHIQRKIGKDEDHATKKPIELVERAIKHATNPKSLVVDLFMGSGSTLVASEKMGRRCYGMELSPGYCDVILSRWEKYTGQKAERIDGTTEETDKRGASKAARRDKLQLRRNGSRAGVRREDSI